MNLNNPYSDLKIFYHTKNLQAFIDNKRIAPIYIRIKPTNICNQNCFYCCYADDRAVTGRKVSKDNFIPKEKMLEILSDIKEIGVKGITLSGGGEPLCYQYIEETLERIGDLEIDFSIITNGQLLSGVRAERLKDAKWVRISLDSANSETYQAIRRVPTFGQVINNIEHFAAIKNNCCELGINFVINKRNYKEVYDICKIISSIGVNNIKFSGLMVQDGTQEYHAHLKDEVKEQISKAKSEFGNNLKIIDKYEENLSFRRYFNKCHIMNFVTVIAANQHVYACHQKAYTESGDLGSIENQSFRELWFSESVKSKINNFSPLQECNAACVYDQRNILLNEIRNLDKNQINFI